MAITKKKVKIPIKKLENTDQNRITNLADLPSLNQKYPHNQENQKLFDSISENPEKFYEGCSNIGQNAKLLGKTQKEIHGKIGAIATLNKNKNPLFSQKARMCQIIANYEGYNVKSPEIKTMELQNTPKIEIQQKLKQKIKALL